MIIKYTHTHILSESVITFNIHYTYVIVDLTKDPLSR
jgi:hypothetical protein